MMRTLPLVAAIALVVFSGVAQGLWTHRWTASRELESAVARLDRIPRNVGDWEGQDQVLDREQLKEARISGHLMRRYRSRRDGSVVTVLLVCGPTGPIAVHTPDICYRGVGYELDADPERVVVRPGGGGSPADFWCADFRKQNALLPLGLRIYWAWATADIWKAPDNPRLTFAGRPALYKLYVICEMADLRTSTERRDPGLEFIRAFLPALEKALVPPA